MVWANDCILLLGVFCAAAAFGGEKKNKAVKFSHTSDLITCLLGPYCSYICISYT